MTIKYINNDFIFTLSETLEVAAYSKQLRSTNDESTLLEWLLLVTPAAGPANTWHSCVQLQECNELSADNVNMVLFERLLLPQPYYVVQPNADSASISHRWWKISTEVDSESEKEHRVLYYLLGVYERCHGALKLIAQTNKYQNLIDVIKMVEDEVSTNFYTAIHQSELYDGQNVFDQLKSLLLDKLSDSTAFDLLITIYLQKSANEESELPVTFSEVSCCCMCNMCFFKYFIMTIN